MKLSCKSLYLNVYFYIIGKGILGKHLKQTLQKLNGFESPLAMFVHFLKTGTMEKNAWRVDIKRPNVPHSQISILNADENTQISQCQVV